MTSNLSRRWPAHWRNRERRTRTPTRSGRRHERRPRTQPLCHLPCTAFTSVVLPDGRIITGYAIPTAQPEPAAVKPAVSRAAVNVALGGVGFLAVCGGLLLTTFIAALTVLITQLITLAAVIFGGWIAVQVFSASGRKSGTTVNIRKAVIKRNKFYG
ncbi:MULTISPECIES: hypothetical protein [Streptomyces]|uniref:Integral membrane protein n=2 Tax=Streptomyces TaxID=1883 RepID=A0ABV9J2M4_9ACTN